MSNLETGSFPKTQKNLKTVLVAGGGSFIGSHLCEALVVQGFKVLCIDDLEEGREKNLQEVKKDKNFQFVHLSYDSKETLKSLGKIDYLFHVAGLEATSKSLNSLLVNSQGTVNLLEKALEDKAEFLYLSLVDIYSGIASRLTLEHYFGPIKKQEAVFALLEAKRFGEALVEEYRKEKKLKAKIIRTRDIYGPRMSLESNFPLNSLISQYLRTSKLQLVNDGLDEIYPTYVSDVVYGLIKAMFSAETEGKVYYLVNPQKITLVSLAKILNNFRKEKLTIEFLEDEQIHFPQTPIDISASKRDLRWFPAIEIEEGIERTLSWYKRASELKNKASVKEISPEQIFTKTDFKYQPTEIVKGKTATELDKERFFDKREKDLEKEPSVLTEKKSEDLNNKIKNTESFWSKLFRRKEEKEEVKKSEKKEIQHQFGKLKLGFLAICLVFIFFGLLSPLFFSLFFVYRGVSKLDQTKQALESLSLSQVQSDSLEAEKSFRTAEGSLNNLWWLFSLFHKREQFQQYIYLLSVGEDVSTSIKTLSTSINPLLGSVDLFLGHDQNQEGIDKIVSQVKVNIVQAHENLSSAQSKLDVLNQSYFPAFLWSKVESLKTQLVQAQEITGQIEVMTDLLPSLTGEETAKTYLIVFQNNSEIRATGGFIGSYAKVSVADGKIADIKVDDVYNPDGQIQETIAPPSPLTQYLNVEKWGMRDGNWSPDFSVSSQDLKMLYKKGTGEEVSGIIAVDLYTVEKLLEAFGPIHPLGYEEEITSSNFFERAEYYSEVGFTPGSTGKKDFLGACSEELLDKILASNAKDLKKVVTPLYQAIEEGHILFSFSDELMQQIMVSRNWAGKISETQGDYLWVIDSNVGGNKANYFVSRALDYQANIERDGIITSGLTITYTHKQEADVWPGGEYKNYLRVYVPQGSVLTNSEGFSAEVKTTQDLNRTVFEGYLTVKVGTTHEIKLNYQLPVNLQLNDKHLGYSFYAQKQLGTIADSFNYQISWPNYFDLKTISGEGVKQEGKYNYTGNLQKDRTFTFKFVKK